VVLERGMMVLLEKQVHLQKDVGAAWVLAIGTAEGCEWIVGTYWLLGRATERKERATDVAIVM
jgi:hypothetical protein